MERSSPRHDLTLTSKMLDARFGVDRSKTVAAYKGHTHRQTHTHTHTDRQTDLSYIRIRWLPLNMTFTPTPTLNWEFGGSYSVHMYGITPPQHDPTPNPTPNWESWVSFSVHIYQNNNPQRDPYTHPHPKLTILVELFFTYLWNDSPSTWSPHPHPPQTENRTLLWIDSPICTLLWVWSVWVTLRGELFFTYVRMDSP